MVARQFLAEPTGLVVGLMAHLAGSERLRASVRRGPPLNDGALAAPALWVLAGVSRACRLDLVGLNAEPQRAVTARVVLEGFEHSRSLLVALPDGPSATAYNTGSYPREVKTTLRRQRVGPGSFTWTFPAHSVTLLQLSVASRLGPPTCRRAPWASGKARWGQGRGPLR